MKREKRLVYLILNAYWEPLEFELPPLNGGPWHRWIDTALDSPMDIVSWQEAQPILCATYRALSRSVVVLIADVRGA
jgi:glycogen operon protein